MKKIIAISMLAGSLAATSAFGQGWMILQQANGTVFDGFTTAGSATKTSNVDVALFWAASGTANPFTAASSLATGNSTTTASYTDAQAWSSILGSSFAEAQQATTTPTGAVLTQSTTKGGVNYLLGSSFGITGSTAGGSAAMILLAWNAAYASPTIAAANGSAIGWSYLSSVTLASGSTDPNIGNDEPSFAAFSTFVPASSVPEPTTIALAGLGGLSLMLARRKK